MKKKRLLDYAGIWANIQGKDWKEIENRVMEARKGIGKSMKKRMGVLNLQ